MLLCGDGLGKSVLVGKVRESWGRSAQDGRGAVALPGGQEHITELCGILAVEGMIRMKMFTRNGMRKKP